MDHAWVKPAGKVHVSLWNVPSIVSGVHGRRERAQSLAVVAPESTPEGRVSWNSMEALVMGLNENQCIATKVHALKIVNGMIGPLEHAQRLVVEELAQTLEPNWLNSNMVGNAQGPPV